MEKELITAVRKEKCLYDLNHPDYVEVKLKEFIWKRIAEALNLKDGNEAKRTWEKLRNNHRDALRRQKKNKKHAPVVKIRPWRFQESMAFLIPHMGTRTTRMKEENQAQSGTGEVCVEENLMDDETHQSSDTSSNNESTDQLHTNKLYKTNISYDPLIYRREHDNFSNTNDFTVNNVKNDPLFHFFISMYETTKRLPPISQHSIKTSVFSLVSQEESNYLLKSSPRSHLSVDLY